MAQSPAIVTVFFIATGAILTSASIPAFAKNEYIAAYGRAEAAYTQWLAERINEGKRPTADERKQKHKELFQDAEQASARDFKGLQERIFQAGKQFMREVKNYNPPPPVLTEEQKKAFAEAPIEAIDESSKKSSLAKLPKSVPTRAVASVVAEKGLETAASASPANTGPVRGGRDIGDVKSGAAETVTFKGNGAAPTHQSAADTNGGAETVNFNNARPPAPPSAR